MKKTQRTEKRQKEKDVHAEELYKTTDPIPTLPHVICMHKHLEWYSRLYRKTYISEMGRNTKNVVVLTMYAKIFNIWVL